MNSQEVINQVNQLMTEGFEIPAAKLKPEATLFQDLGLDSLDAVDLIVHLEEKLDVKVNVENMASIRSLNDVYQLVTELVGNSGIAG